MLLHRRNRKSVAKRSQEDRHRYRLRAGAVRDRRLRLGVDGPRRAKQDARRGDAGGPLRRREPNVRKVRELRRVRRGGEI